MQKMSEYNKTKCLMTMLFRYGNPVDHIPFYMIQFDLSSSNQAQIRFLYQLGPMLGIKL